MPSELDRLYEAVYAQVTGPGGIAQLGEDALGRGIVANFPQTLPGLFKAFCAMHAGVEAVVAGDERLSFADLDRLSDRVAGALVARGVAPGQRVAIAMRNCPSWIIVHMAALKAGAVSTLLNGWWQHHELAHALALTDPVLVVADAPRARRIADAGLAGTLVTLDIDRPADEALAPLLVDGHEAAVLPMVGPDDDATILFTSGTTGEAKGAVSTHRAVVNGTYSYALSLATLKGILLSRGQEPLPPRTLVSVPFFHVTGEVPVLLNSFVIGRGMVLMPKWDAGEALRLIEAERVTYFVGVPTMSLELMNHPDRASYRLETLRDITGGGAPRPVAHVERLQQAFPNAQPALGYGMTETNAVGCGNFWANYAAKPASTGKALPMVEVRVCDDDDQPLPTGTVGEIHLRASANIRGYWRNEAATAATLTADGSVRTGDLGFLDADGYLTIVDRKKDIIIRGGENISAAEVEAALYACDGIAEAVVFGMPDERLGEVPVAVLHRRDGASVDEATLRTLLGPRLAAFKHPATIRFSADPLPRLGTGKLDRVAIKQAYPAG